MAPPGSALLLSLGFRPVWLAPDRAWQLAAVVSLAMADAAEDVIGLPAGAIRLKWPNDLVVTSGDGHVRKLAGLLGETDGLGTADPRVVVGIGVNTEWAVTDFPPELADSMTSLREVAADRPIDHAALLAAFLDRLEAGTGRLRSGEFEASRWADRQVTTGRMVRLATAAGDETLRAVGVDPLTGALIVADPSSGGERHVVVGDITHVRLAEPIAGAV